MKESYVAGVDIGGTHITAALVSLEEKKIANDSYVRRYVDAHGTVDEIITAWSEAIQTAIRYGKFPVQKIGIAMPGPFDYFNGVSYITGQNKFESLYCVNVKQLLAERLNTAAENILLTNDAGCFLLGEAFNGAAKEYDSAIGLTLGTGLGTARFLNGTVEDANLWCSPFKETIAEDYLSTRWFVKRCYELSGIELAGVKEILQHSMTAGCVQQLFDEFAENLALFLQPYIQEEKPGVVVLGGNIAQAHNWFLPQLEKFLTNNGVSAVRIARASLGETAPVYGAASAWSYVTCD